MDLRTFSGKCFVVLAVMKRLTLGTTALLIVLVANSATDADEAPPFAASSQAHIPDTVWPAWRGGRQGVAPHSTSVPAHWSENENVSWVSHVPGNGFSSPIVVGKYVFLTTCDEDTGTQLLLCYDREHGEQSWSAELHKGKLPTSHQRNSQASATPASDGTHVYTVFVINEGLWLSKISMDGDVVWQKRIGDFVSEFGYGPSPVLFGEKIIISGEHHCDGFLAAIDKENGDLVWKIVRPIPGKLANYANPAVDIVAGKPQVIIHGYDFITSYDPDTGETIWKCRGPAEVCANTPVLSKDFVYASGGYPEKHLLCIRADGSGDVTDTHLEWQERTAITYVPSSVLLHDRLYSVNDQGIATCHDAESGDAIWRHRFEGNFWSSPIIVGELVYASNEAGTTFVFRAADKFELIAENKLPGLLVATPAVAVGRLFVRTDKQLFCIGRQ